MQRWCAVLLAAATAAGAPVDGAEPPPAAQQTVTLSLEHGVENGTTMVLDLSLRGGRFETEAWGTAYGYNLSQHTGTVNVSHQMTDSLRMSVKLQIECDTVAPSGAAAYDIALTRRGDEFSGDFTGVFNDAAVTGAVSGRVRAQAVRDVQGHEPLQAAEHPRLIFRKRDLPELRRRMDTPEGKAILSMLNERSPLREASPLLTDRYTSWMAANWGAIYQLTGDTNAPVRARELLLEEVITRPMQWDRKDIHHASRLLGIALAYDLCYDAWDETYRRLLGEYLRVAASELSRGNYEGFGMEEQAWDPAPWGHRNAIRMSCAGLAALAILGDPDTGGKPLPDTGRMLKVADRHVEQYLRMGVTQAGTGLEGVFPRDFALANGVLQYLHASRVARGRDFSAINPLVIAGNIVGARPSGSNTFDFAMSGITVQTSGLWPMGLGTVPMEFLPGMKWCFDRDAGLLGKQHFGCAYPYQAAYALKNYPFDVQARPPGEVLTLHAADIVNGHFLMRNRWQDADDAIVELYLNSRGMPPARVKDMELAAGVISVSGLGTTFLRGFAGASRINDKAAAELLYSEIDGKRLYVGMDLSDVYRRAPVKPKPRGGMTREFKTIQKVQWQKAAIQDFLKPPVREKGGPGETNAVAQSAEQVIRHVAVDMTGECGAPVLVAIAERCGTNAAGPWRIPVQGPITSTAGGQFLAGDTNGVNLVGRFIVPSDARVSGGQVAGKGEYFVVFTLQRGAAPASTVDGTGFEAKLRMAGRTVSFDGRRIILAK